VRVLIAGLTARAIAESARRAGYEPLTVDFFGDLDTKRLGPNVSLRERGQPYSAGALLEAARDVSADAVAYVGGLENHPGIVAALAAGRTLLGNPPEVLARVRDPQAVFAFLRGRGFVVPETRGRIAPRPRRGRWLRKPERGGGGQGVRFWDGRRLGAGQLLQEFIDGWSASLAFVADGRRALVLGWTRQRHAAPGFRYAGNVLPLDGPRAAFDEASAVASALTEEFGLRGLNGIDFVLHAGRPVVLEVNPRYTASMELIERAAGTPVFGLHVAALTGTLPPAPPPIGPGYWGKAIVYADRPRIAPATGAWIRRGVRDVPIPGSAFTRGQPICTVFAHARSAAQCETALERRGETLRRACPPAPRPRMSPGPVPRRGPERRRRTGRPPRSP
jgi:uncharacterized protein